MTPTYPQDNYRMGPFTRRPITWLDGWNLELWVGEEGAGDWAQSHAQWFNQSWLHNETSIKALDIKGHRSFLADEDIEVPVGWLTPWGELMETAIPPRLSPRCTLYDKLQLLSSGESCMPSAVLVNYWTRGVHGNPQICSRLVRSMGVLETIMAGMWSVDLEWHLVKDWPFNLQDLTWILGG